MPGSDIAEFRPILTFAPRRGRMTSGQRRSFEQLWPTYGVEVSPQRLAVAALFGRTAPLVLEIGFGMGEATALMAAADPARDVLAVDVHTPGAGALCRELDQAGLRNVRVVLGDAVDVLRDMLAPGSLDEVRAFFPDPWPKARHTKRRLVGASVAALIAERLRVGGRLHLATDWPPYAEQMLQVVAAEPLLRNDNAGYADRPAWRPVTRFEHMALAKGHHVYDLIATRVPGFPDSIGEPIREIGQ
jgi:tRNA (guanine-N7-)-methyltransferase